MNPRSDKSNDGILDDAVLGAIRNDRLSLHTLLPAEIVTFYPDDQTADVKVMLKKNFGGQVVEMPILPKCPVEFPRAGGFIVTFPVAAGDPCSVKFSERSLDAWWFSGEVSDPADPRLHDLSDGIVVLGLHSQVDAISTFDPVNFSIQSLDGANSIVITPTGDIVASNPAASASVFATGQVVLANTNGSATLNADGTFAFQGVSEELLSLLVDLIDVISAAEVQHSGTHPLTAATQLYLDGIKTRLLTLI